MKDTLFTLFLFLISNAGFSQNSVFEYRGRYTPEVKKEKLNKVNFVSEITPELWSSMQLQYNDRQELNNRRKTDFTQGSAFNTSEYNYNKIVDYVFVEISASSNGKTISSQSTGDLLTMEQKHILTNADPGSDINIKVNFRFKNQASNISGDGSKIKKGEVLVTVIPETEAEFPGGYKQLSDYFTENLFHEISEKSRTDKIFLASVKFTINEDGQVTGAKIIKTSTDPRIDKLIVDQTNKMPKWKPAKNSDGKKIKQEFNIPFGGGGGC